MIDELSGLSAILPDYDAIVCDVWGVVHNGIAPHAAAGEALTKARAAGVAVVLVTNAPRPSPSVIEQLLQIGAPESAYDQVVSSGDVTRQAIIDGGFATLHHIGPKHDLVLFDDLAATLTETPADADAIVCTDLRTNDGVPEDYRAELSALVPLQKPFLCGNPDIVVERGGDIVYCGGSLAKVYEDAGGSARQFGKPHAPIYEMALKTLGHPKRVLAIGDGLPTDITGANAQGFDVLFITGGIHEADLGAHGAPDRQKVADRLAAEGLTARAYMPRLTW
ncbi:MAG: TIGR01459 family HAD-type hydrolase [Pseudomonadota bacterium]